MIEGSLYTSSYDGRKLKLSWSRKSYSVAKNESYVHWVLSANGGNASWYYTSKVKVAINGKVVYSHPESFKCSAKTIASGDVTIKHNVDGTKTFSASVEAAVYDSAVNCKGSKSFTLNSIPQATIPETDKTRVFFDDVVKINTPRKSTTFHHKVRYKFGSSSGVIDSDVQLAVNWKIPADLMKRIPNSTEGVITIYCDTFDGTTATGKLIGTKTTTITGVVPAYIKPKINDIVMSETNPDVLTSNYVYEVSKIKMTVNAVGSYGSTIKSYETKANKQVFKAQSFTTGALTLTGECLATATVVDSRGRTTTFTKKYNVVGRPTEIGITSKATTGELVAIAAPVKAKGYHNKISYVFGSAKGNIVDDSTATSLSWTVPMSLLRNMPNKNSATCYVTCYTYDGPVANGNLIGTRKREVVINCPSTAKPSVDEIIITEANAAVKDAFGVFLQFESQLNVNVKASGFYGSTIESYASRVNGKNYTSKDFQTGKLEYWGDLKLETVITDSRSKNDTSSRIFNVKRYRQPTINEFTAAKCLADGTPSRAGTYLKIRVSGEIEPVDNLNTRSLKIRYKCPSDLNWNLVNVPVSTYSFDIEKIMPNVKNDESYILEAQLSDKLHTVTDETQTGQIVISRHAGGDGVTFLGEATKSGVWNAETDTSFPPELFRENIKTTVLPANGTTYTQLAEIDVRPGVYLVTASARFSEVIDVARAFKILADNYEVAVHASDLGFGGASLTGIVEITTDSKINFLGRQTTQTERKLENIQLRAFKLG